VGSAGRVQILMPLHSSVQVAPAVPPDPPTVTQEEAARLAQNFQAGLGMAAQGVEEAGPSRRSCTHTQAGNVGAPFDDI
jgi:hypothetical protein